MNLNPIASNMTELDINGNKILFSYRTPVAAIVDGILYKTEKRWSNTTSRHISKWGAKAAQEKPQEFFDGLVK